MHTFDRQLDLGDRLRVIAYPNKVRTFEALIGNVLRKRMLIIQRDFERRDPIILPPNIFLSGFVVSGTDQNAVERQGAFYIERNVLADAIVVGALGPGSFQLALRISLNVDDVVIVLVLRSQRRTRLRIIIRMIEKVLVV